MPKSKSNCHDQLDRMQSIMKDIQDNDVIDRTCVISVEYNTKLSSLIGWCVVNDKNETRQRRYRWYRFTLCRKGN